MALTPLSMRNDVWMDGVAVAGQDLRLQQSGALLTGASPSGSTGIAARPGVRYGTGTPLLVAASSGMTLAVSAGIAWVQGTASANAGMYTGCLDTSGTVTLATSDPTNPRIDNIIVQVTDVGTSSSTTVVTPQTGTPAASPVAPTLPANSLLLAQVSVAASTSTIVAGNITDKRVYTAASGGIVPMANTTSGISGLAGLYAHDLSSGRLRVSDGSGNAVAPKTGPFAPVIATNTSAVTLTNGTTSTIVSASFTVDGATEVRALLNIPGLYMTNNGTDFSFEIDCLLDGTISRAWPLTSSGTVAGKVFGAGTYIHFMTPAAGTHTVLFQIQNASSTNATTNLRTGSPIYLRISAESG